MAGAAQKEEVDGVDRHLPSIIPMAMCIAATYVLHSPHKHSTVTWYARASGL